MSDKTSRKPERLASAVYLVSSFFSDQEPMKWRLRSLASDMVSVSTSLRDTLASSETQSVLKQRSIVSELHSLFSVARDSGLVSDTNYKILSEELGGYLSNLSLPAGLKEEQGSLTLALEPSNKDVESGATHTVHKTTEETNSTKQEEVKDKSRENTSETPSKEVEKEVKSSRPTQLKEFGAVSVKKNNRKSIIISLLKRKKEIMIKDVSPLISDCSDKTIQRELAALVKEGILKKEGEKRWSTYSLA